MKKMCYRCMQLTVENGFCSLCGVPFIQRTENNNLLPLGTRIDNGSIIVGDKLGNGGFGITYIARERELGLIALKEFMPRHMVVGGRDGLNVRVQADRREMYAKSLASFQREAKLLSIMRHPNIVRILFSLSENNTAYYGMELMKGEDLAHFVRQNGPLAPKDACQLLAPVMDALIYVHGMGVLHRDISPDNIFLREEPGNFMDVSPCLIDFGAAYTARLDFTQTAPKVKKSGYSPLEQNWELDKQGPFTDVYAFTATYYYLVTGCVPGPAAERHEQPLVPVSTINRDATNKLDMVIEHGMAVHPAERIQNISQLRDELFRACGMRIPAANANEYAVNDFQHGFSDELNALSESQEISDEPRRSGRMMPRRLLAMALDWAIFTALPTAVLYLVADVAGLAIGLGLGVLLQVAINLLLCMFDPPGTVGQRIMSVAPEVRNYSIAKVLAGNLMRAIFPVGLADWTIACMTGNLPAHEAMIGSGSEADEDDIQDVPDTIVPDAPKRVMIPQAHLRCTAGMLKDRIIEIGAVKTFGRDPDFAMVVYPADCRTISGKHCAVRFAKNGWRVQDMNSSNGTYVNGKRLEPGGHSAQLKPGDVIRIGGEEFTFENV